MKTFYVTLVMEGESFNGYSTKTTLKEIVEARNTDSAKNKAIRAIRRSFGKYALVHISSCVVLDKA